MYDPAATLTSMGERIKHSYPLAFSEGQRPLPDKPAFVHLFAGLVQLADWLGSDTREGFFPYTAPGEDRSQTAAVRARYAVQAIGLDVDFQRRASPQLENSSEFFRLDSYKTFKIHSQLFDICLRWSILIKIFIYLLIRNFLDQKSLFFHFFQRIHFSLTDVNTNKSLTIYITLALFSDIQCTA